MLRRPRPALPPQQIPRFDLLSVGSASARLFRRGAYPPLRGTLLTLDDREQILYTRGSVEFFSTYPGMYVPQPLAMRVDAGDTTAKELARETLALTKMNWNDTQFDGSCADHDPGRAPGWEHPQVRRSR